MSGLRRYAEVFDRVAAEYDKHRSGYPPELVDLALERGGVAAGAPVLEVGCGTGKLTELLAERGLEIDAVDPGARMIQQARRRVRNAPNVRFHHARFEDVDLPAEAYDAVFSATAFHWVEPEVGWAKVAGHLRDGGLLALLTHTEVADGATPGVADEFRRVLDAHAPQITSDLEGQMDLARLDAIARTETADPSRLWDAVTSRRHGLVVDEAAALFAGARLDVVVTPKEETADELVAEFRTTSAWARVDPDRRAPVEADIRAIIERRGGRITTALATVLMTATRVARRSG